ncbi:MAG: NAD(P)-dependent oxidoreductase [Campylobacterales bacterium]|nr:NAD(P)-dependent oxidoreductase [Campylobacterales bacterium]
MIVGNGQLAQVFKDCNNDDTCIFASGVANSNCQDEAEFEREKKLLIKHLEENVDKKFVYFSSCALSAPEYQKNEYYMHKEKMEELIKEYSENYYIFRIPQLFGKLKDHKTLINFLYESVLKGNSFKVYSDAYRYVIEIEDVRKLVESYLSFSKPNITVDLANPYRYKVLEIVQIFEDLLNKKANYEIIKKEDLYELNLSELLNFIEKNEVCVEFSEKYLKNKLQEKIKESN